MVLREHGPDAGGRGVNLADKGDLRIRVTKDGGHAESFFDMLEGFMDIGAPGQGLGLATQHGGERRCEPTEQMDETSIEHGES